MDQVAQHKDLRQEWKSRSLAYQLGNIGSEVSRAIKNQDKPARFRGAFDRALELFDLTIECTSPDAIGTLRELCRAREEFCDYFNGNTYNTNPKKMQKYYDDFAMMRR